MQGLIVTQIIQIVVSVLLVILVMVQSKGTGLFSAFSGSIGFYRSKRGLEKFIFISTIFLGIALSVNSLVIILLS